ncbi:NADP-dependent oxidoreductase [Actinocrispum wychmicini]|uniref:NADPH:quinone reductase-like Zn-dependent oxidoreductase n=1 Tax=Actinocrispum wychmicini TaxID=1213861 RepID=A0A4R2IRN1_9PSEU|nr:NADP-dependent oxidoreductase [Actinocrispum wychmicini]TCO48081.1 NADPH:quinone reductase-like Zn-dependent oxidoreductase [Actinocrispum wychmicini]
MRVIEVTQYGGPEVLRLTERPEPEAVAGRVRVRMHAGTVNPTDLDLRQGVLAALTPDLLIPFTVGWEIAGTVLDDAEGFTAGQRVIGLYPWLAEGTGEGTNAEVVLAAPGWLTPLPDGIDWATAATIPMNSLTARQGLDLLTAQPGGTVLITGASGGVGGFAVQIAARDGLNVIAVASAGDEDYVAGLGAKQVITRGEPLPTDVDAMFDPAVTRDLSPIRTGGRYVGVRAPALTSERDIDTTVVFSAPDSAQLAELTSLRTRVADVLPIERVAEAHTRTAAGGLRGKIVLAF